MKDLSGKIKSKTARVGVVGLGYVGLPLALEFAKAGFETTGIDTDSSRVEKVNQAASYLTDVSDEDLRKAVGAGKLKAVTGYDCLRELDTVSICVPTPLRKTKEPDVSFVLAAAREIAARLRPGQLIVLESTTYPGTTEEAVQPLLEEGGLRAGEDFFLAFSPERVDPGNAQYKTGNIPKVVGGVTARCTEMAQLLYGQVVSSVVPVSSSRVAETVKLLENTFRSVNIALVNELAVICHRLGIDVWEVIDAAATKPFGFMPFYPGPGLGGHCIPIDPHYLSWKARLADAEPRFIDLAGEINRQMPRHVVERVADALNQREKSVRGARILVLGAAYKKDISDSRESPARDIIAMLLEKGARVSYCDPHVPSLDIDGTRLEAVEFGKQALRESDCAVIVTDHSAFDYRLVVDEAPLVLDTRNSTRGLGEEKGNIVRL